MHKLNSKKPVLFFDLEITQKIKNYIEAREIEALKKFINSFAKKFSLNDIYFHSAKLLANYGFLAEAEEFYRKVLLNNPLDRFVVASLGVLISAQEGREEEALELILDAINLNPDQRELNRIVGYIYTDQKKHFLAKKHYEKELELLKKQNAPACMELIAKYATTCSQSGDLKTAMEYHEQSLKNYPNVIEFYGEMIFSAAHSFDYDDCMINEIGRRCSATAIYQGETHSKFKAEIAKIVESNNYMNFDKIKLGIISASMHGNNAERFVADILEYFDYDKFELYSYYTGTTEDILTQKFEMLSHSFKKLKYNDHLGNAKTIANDGIHILFDTVGFLKGQNLTTMSLKPAPIQIMGYGFWGSTGLEEMDYVLLQENLASEEIKTSYTEEILELSAFYYNSLYKGLEILDPPYKRRGYVTFGCQNRIQKINDQVLKLWADILDKVPNSKLLLTINTGDSEVYKEKILRFFIDNGIDVSRILNLSSFQGLSYLEVYNQIDVVLDPFPFAGGCTSFDALSMGKPIITLSGDRMTQQMTTDFLNDLGLSELSTSSKEEYVDKAVEFVNNPEKVDEYSKYILNNFDKFKFADAKYCGKELQQKLELIFKKKFNQLPWE
ncbi:MAG: hypothetical protein HRT47_08105 [Candidatus Caenarcaniphilales bacterium]|nr:hypothetical protein [Candidatus Caenarcaniphilales bacterium]